MTTRFIYVRCTGCGHAEERLVDTTDVRRRSNGDLLPLWCNECAAPAAEVAPRPWALSYADRQLLHRLRIDDDVTATT